MATRFTLALIMAGLGLAVCTQPQAPRTALTMAGTAAGACENPLSAAARDGAGSGCPAGATQGVPRIAGCDQGPQVAYGGTPMGIGDPSRRLGQYGMRSSCP